MKKKRVFEQISAPFSEDQIESVMGYQQSGICHALTCKVHTDVTLQAGQLGLSCPKCSFLQKQVPAFVADGSWRKFVVQVK